jgi:hypothetical protein
VSGYISFKRFITPTFIMIIYILGALVITLGSILVMAFGAGLPGGTAVAVIAGIAGLIFGNLAWRLICEYWVVQFRIYEEIAALNRHMGGTSPQPAAPPPSPAATPTCPTCGGPLRYIQQYQRWYCDKEQKYV